MPLFVTPGQLSQRADFYFQLASLTNAGVPIIDALEMLRNSASRSYRQHLARAVDRLKQGDTLTEGLTASGSFLPNFDLSLLNAGEQSGRLDSVLRMLGNYYQEQASLLRTILHGLAYPAFLIHLALLVFPTGYLTGVLLAGGVERLIRQKIIVFATLYALIIGALLLAKAPFGKVWRNFLFRAANAVPILGAARKNLFLTRFSAALEALLSAGVPIIDSWEMASNASGSPDIQKAVSRAIPEMQAGVTPGESLQRMRVFPEMFRNLYASGELSGQLDDTMRRLRNYYQEQASLKFQSFGQWTPRVIVLIIAIAIGIQIVTFYIGYFGQIGQAGF